MTADPPYVPLTITVAALVAAAAVHAADGEHDTAEALLAAACRNLPERIPQLDAYRAFIAALPTLEAGGWRRTPGSPADQLETSMRVQLLDLLTRGPNAPAATGLEEF